MIMWGSLEPRLQSSLKTRWYIHIVIKYYCLEALVTIIDLIDLILMQR